MLLLLLPVMSVLAGLAAAQHFEFRVVPVHLADATGAKCLDGSPPTYSIERNQSSNNWILFLEGGGWCMGPSQEATIQSCAQRAGVVAAQQRAAAAVAANGPDCGGVLSSNQTLNPDFHTWNHVFLHYCDGSSFGGSRLEPINVTAGHVKQIWLRGRNNFDALIATLQQQEGMAAAEEIILSGGSAGGLAVFFNLDHLAQLIGYPHGPVKRLTGFPDAGFFLDHATLKGTYDFRTDFQSADPVWNVTGSGGTNAACLQAYAASEHWKCLMAPYLSPHIQTPLFVMNSAYDAYQVQNILDIGCVPDSGSCSASQQTALQSYRAAFVEAVASVYQNRTQNGVYVDSCYVHEQNVDYCYTQSVPNCVGWMPLCPGSLKWHYHTQVNVTGSGALTPQQAFGDYYLRRSPAHRVVVDMLAFPLNPSCPFHGKP
eukprot:m.84387 g.84387  ORF g.84387 m.84387 type:complete len:428 (-) comp17792_c0_seq1:117-1400(-)